jgi:hypothetical protein
MKSTSPLSSAVTPLSLSSWRRRSPLIAPLPLSLTLSSLLSAASPPFPNYSAPPQTDRCHHPLPNQGVDEQETAK